MKHAASLFYADGEVIERLRGGFFRCNVAGNEVLARTSAKMWERPITITQGDRVKLEIW